MARLQYIGGANKYILESADLKRHGVEGFTKTTWSKENSFVAEVSDDAANKLVELMPKSFKVEGDSKSASDDDSSDDEPSSDDASSSDAGSSRKPARKP